MEISCEHIMIQVLECLPGPSGSFSPVVVKINTFLNGLKISGVFLEIIFFYDIIKTTVDLLSDSNPSVHEARLRRPPMHKIEIYFELFIMSLFLRLECELNVETDVTCSRHAEHINALQSITY